MVVDLQKYKRARVLRGSLVRELRGRIVAGRYYVPAERIVERLLAKLLSDKIAV